MKCAVSKLDGPHAFGVGADPPSPLPPTHMAPCTLDVPLIVDIITFLNNFSPDTPWGQIHVKSCPHPEIA